jgi:hypothetical protein
MPRARVLTIGEPVYHSATKGLDLREALDVAGVLLFPALNVSRTIRVLHVCAKSASYHEHPVVVPHVMHFRHVPFLTIVNWPQSPQGSPS